MKRMRESARAIDGFTGCARVTIESSPTLKTPWIAAALFFVFLAQPARYSVLPVAQAQNASQVNFEPLNSSTVAAYVRQEALAYGVNPVDALWIVSHESQDGQNMRGDDGQSRGYWMISDVYHPEVSTACVDNLQCSTDWSLNWIKAGHIDQWSTWKYRFEWYPAQNPPL
jgi:hypothetical protein